MTTGILELAVVIFIAAVLSVIAKMLRQPIILAYLATGALIGVSSKLGYFSSLHLGDGETFQLFADLGIMFLLFLVGLEVNYKSLRLVGKVSLVVGILQVLFTFGVGYFIAINLGFGVLASVYISIALTFSSTIIIVKLLSEKRQLNSLFGRISIGVLLVQDMVAILILIVLSGIHTGDVPSASRIIGTLLTGITLFIVMLWLGKRLFPYLFDKVAGSQELLFLMSLAWVFLVVAVVQKLGFSVEIGGFLAGIALANASEHYQIVSRVRSLRDFFILIFFAILGSSLLFADFSGVALSIIIFSLFVLIGNPLIVLVVMGFMGYQKRTSFLTGLTVAQISEFSLILAALGLKLGHITTGIVSLITAVGVLTITVSTYMIIHADSIYRRLERFLSYFERRIAVQEKGIPGEISKPIIVVGFRRTGQSIAMHLKKEDLLIIDFDPEITQTLRGHGYAFVFGDISDYGIFEQIDLSATRLIISTSPVVQDNLSLAETIQRFNVERKEKRKPVIQIILRAEDDNDAELLYKKGADYVLLPHFTSGHYLGSMIAAGADLKMLEAIKRRELLMLKKEDREAARFVSAGPFATRRQIRDIRKHI